MQPQRLHASSRGFLECVSPTCMISVQRYVGREVIGGVCGVFPAGHHTNSAQHHHVNLSPMHITTPDQIQSSRVCIVGSVQGFTNVFFFYVNTVCTRTGCLLNSASDTCSRIPTSLHTSINVDIQLENLPFPSFCSPPDVCPEVGPQWGGGGKSAAASGEWFQVPHHSSELCITFCMGPDESHAHSILCQTSKTELPCTKCQRPWPPIVLNMSFGARTMLFSLSSPQMLSHH